MVAPWASSALPWWSAMALTATPLTTLLVSSALTLAPCSIRSIDEPVTSIAVPQATPCVVSHAPNSTVTPLPLSLALLALSTKSWRSPLVLRSAA